MDGRAEDGQRPGRGWLGDGWAADKLWVIDRSPAGHRLAACWLQTCRLGGLADPVAWPLWWPRLPGGLADLMADRKGGG